MSVYILAITKITDAEKYNNESPESVTHVARVVDDRRLSAD
jgi:hypothetical protein